METQPPASPKRPYETPELTAFGSVEELTGWIGGPWGEFFGGPVSGWNPWSQPGPASLS